MATNAKENQKSTKANIAQKSTKNNEVKNILENLVLNNEQIRSLFSQICSSRFGTKSEISKALLPTLELGSEKTFKSLENEFNGKVQHGSWQKLQWSAVLNLSAGTFWNVSSQKAAYYSKKWEALNQIEEILKEALKISIFSFIYEQRFTATKNYAKQRKLDLDEFKARKNAGDASNQEIANAKANFAQAQAYEASDNSELTSSSNFSSLIFGKKVRLSDNSLASFLERKYTQTSSLIKAKFDLKAAKSKKIQALTSPTPQLSASYSNQNNPELNPLQTNGFQRRFKGPALAIKASVQLGPSSFFDIFASAKSEEAAKLNFEWKKKEDRSKFDSLKSELKSLQQSLNSANLAVQASELEVKAKKLAYNEGQSNYFDLSEARSNYYQKLRQLYDIKKSYIEKSLDLMKITGYFREIAVSLNENKEI